MKLLCSWPFIWHLLGQTSFDLNCENKKSLLTNWLHPPPPRQTCIHWPSAWAEGIPPRTGHTENSVKDRGRVLLNHSSVSQLCNEKKQNIVRESSTMSSIWNTKQIRHMETAQSKTCMTVTYQTQGSPHACQEYYTPTHARSQSSSTLPSHLSRNLRLESEGGWEEETIC